MKKLLLALVFLAYGSIASAQVVGQGSSGAVGDPWYVTGTVTFSNTTINIGAALPTGANTIGAVNLAQYTPNSGRLPVYLGDVIGTRSSTTDHTDSIQIGGTTTPGNEWNAAQVTAADPLQNANGLVVRNLSGTGTPGVSAPPLFNAVAGRDPVTNALRQMDLKTSDPVGTENGLITRNIPSGVQPVSATQLPAALAAGGGLKVEGIVGGVPQPVSGTVAATQGTTPWVDNISQFGGSAVTLGQMPSAASIPVVLPSNWFPPPDRSAISSIATNGAVASVTSGGTGTVTVAITGTWVGSFLPFGIDGAGAGNALYALNGVSGQSEQSITANGIWEIPSAGWSSIGLTSISWTSGTASIALIAGVQSNVVALGRSLPTGVNPIGQVTANAGTNLNTSLLAREAGGNLATTATNTRVRGTSGPPVMVMATNNDTQLLAANTSRVQWSACNRSRAPMFVKFGSGATLFSYNVYVAPGTCYTDSSYTGQVDATWDVGADQFAMISETS